MANQAVVASQSLIPKTGIRRFWLNFKRNWQLHLMMVVPFLYLLVFHYFPMYGIQISFKEYSPRLGIPGSEWTGLANFKAFFEYYKWPNLVVNTLSLSLYSIFVGFPIPIVLALILHVNTNKALKKVAQNVSYVPHFISLVVMVGILNTVLNPVSGFLGYFYKTINNVSLFIRDINVEWELNSKALEFISKALKITSVDDIRGSKNAFRHLYIWSGVWQSMGWSTIMYVSALSAVPDDLHEAAKLDGASRLRRVLSVDLPTIMPTIAIMLIMRFGGVMSVGYQKAYLMQNNMNIDVSELISTYVYKTGLRSGNMSFGTAIGLLNSVINTVIVFVVNWVTNLLTDNEMGLF